MSEKAPQASHEHAKNHEAGSEHHKAHEVHHAKPESHEVKVPTKEDIDKLSSEARTEANESKPVENEENESHQHHIGTHQSLKKDAYRDVLEKTRKRLPRRLRSFSKIVHNNTVDSLSNISAYTVARPSGLLGGGIGAFVGSSLLLYFSRRYGFKYNFGALIAFFIGGFLIGLLVEALYKIFKRKKAS